MTDLSKLFKTTVKAVKLNLNIDSDLNEELGLKKQKTVNVIQNYFNVSKEAQNLVKNLTKLKENLVKNKLNYVQPK